MGNHIQKRALDPELTQSQLNLIKQNVKKSDDEIREWYQEFYEIADGKHLSRSDFVKYYKDLLPYRGDSEDFCKLVFKSKKSEFCLFYLKLKSNNFKIFV